MSFGRRRRGPSTPILLCGIFIFFGLMVYINYYLWVSHWGTPPRVNPTPPLITEPPAVEETGRPQPQGVGALQIKKGEADLDKPPAPFQKAMDQHNKEEREQDKMEAEEANEHITPFPVAQGELPDGTEKKGDDSAEVGQEHVPEDLPEHDKLRDQRKGPEEKEVEANKRRHGVNEPPEEEEKKDEEDEEERKDEAEDSEEEPENGLVDEQRQERNEDTADPGPDPDHEGEPPEDGPRETPAPPATPAPTKVHRSHHHHHRHGVAPEEADDTPSPSPSAGHHHHHRPHEHGKHHHRHGVVPTEGGGDAEEKPDNKDNGIESVQPAGDNDEEKDAEVEHIDYDKALQMYHANMKHDGKQDNDVTDAFTSVHERPNHGVLLPHDSKLPHDHRWVYCDPADTDFTDSRDAKCQGYLSNLNNMRSVKALSSELYNGRTIKYKVYYWHNGIEAMIKVSQKKFVFEASSEYLAFTIDRMLGFTRVPPTAYVPIPLDYLKAASGVLSPFFSTWFENFIPKYDYTKRNLYRHTGDHLNREWTNVTVQVWMYDVHSALYTKLALNYQYNKPFLNKFYVIGGYEKATRGKKWPPRENQWKAVSDVGDRFIFDYLLGNTDRGMNDHNNFVYGGCPEKGGYECANPPPGKRTKRAPKYAFLDHGSSFYTHKEPEGSPFTGNSTETIICRFRRSTYQLLKDYTPAYKAHHDGSPHPLIHEAKKRLPEGFFKIAHYQTFTYCQQRLEKVVRLIDECVRAHGEDNVFSLKEV